MWDQLTETCWARLDKKGFVFVPEDNHDIWVGKPTNHPAKGFKSLQEAMIYVDLAEDIPTNSMGLSSSIPSTGAIDTFDPLIVVKKRLKDRILAIWRRKPPSKK